jgi:hypothetical protein
MWGNSRIFLPPITHSSSDSPRMKSQ